MSSSPLYKSIAAKLSDDIKAGRLKDGSLPSESALCESFKASRITIRGALKLLESDGIVESIPGKGRRVVGVGGPRPLSKLSSKRPLRINCVVQSPLENRVLQIIYNSLQQMVLRDGWLCSMCFVDTGLGLPNFEHTLSAANSDALFCVGMNNFSMIERVEASGIPAVHVNCHNAVVAHQVSTDNFAGGLMVGRHLATHRISRVLVLRREGDAGNFEFDSRIGGLSAALRLAFGAGSFSLDILSLHGDSSPAAEFLEAKRPEAVFMVTDKLAEALFGVLDRLGMSFPKDISVVGFDNMVNTPKVWQRDVDSIEQPLDAIAEAAYRKLMELISSGRGVPPSSVLLRPSLSIKGSVA